jgi:hypothetical protein
MSAATNARSCRIWTYDESVEGGIWRPFKSTAYPTYTLALALAIRQCHHDTAHCDMFNCSCNLVQGKGDLRCACQPIKTDGDPYIYKRMECIQFTQERRQATTAKATRPSSNLDTRKTYTRYSFRHPDRPMGLRTRSLWTPTWSFTLPYQLHPKLFVFDQQHRMHQS